MPTIELPDGHTAELRDLSELRRGDVRVALRLADAQGAGLQDGQFGLGGIAAVQDGLLTQFIRSWTVTNDAVGLSVNGNGAEVLPVTFEALGKLPLAYHRPLANAITPVLAEVLGGEAPTPVDPTSAAPSSTSAPTG